MPDTTGEVVYDWDDEDKWVFVNGELTGRDALMVEGDHVTLVPAKNGM